MTDDSLISFYYINLDRRLFNIILLHKPWPTTVYYHSLTQPTIYKCFISFYSTNLHTQQLINHNQYMYIAISLADTTLGFLTSKGLPQRVVVCTSFTLQYSWTIFLSIVTAATLTWTSSSVLATLWTLCSFWFRSSSISSDLRRAFRAALLLS